MIIGLGDNKLHAYFFLRVKPGEDIATETAALSRTAMVGGEGWKEEGREESNNINLLGGEKRTSRWCVKSVCEQINGDIGLEGHRQPSGSVVMGL